MSNQKSKNFSWVIAVIIGLICLGCLGIIASNANSPDSRNDQFSSFDSSADQDQDSETLYDVVSIIDGDTIKINYNGEVTSLRLIGIDTPETSNPNTDTECFGKEATQYLTQLLSGKQITIASDDTQSDRDKYDRLLRYVYLDGNDVGLDLLNNGYAREYTYETAYAKQSDYKQAQQTASTNKKGLWTDGICAKAETPAPAATPAPASTTTATPATTSAPAATPAPTSSTADCNIKGNINSSGERIYHVPGQRYYNQTNINTSAGERWFCSEAEAVAAGWRRSKV